MGQSGHAPMSAREGGVSIPGITDSVISCASTPFALALMWTRYVPLSTLLERTPDFVVRGERDGTSRILDWRHFEPVGTLVRIPGQLYDMTRAHIDATRSEREASPDYTFSMSPFFANGRFVSVDDVFEHVADIVTSIRLLSDSRGCEG